MIGNKNEFSFLTLKKGGRATFEGNNKRQIIEIGIISMSSNLIIRNVLQIEGLKHNPLSIS